MSGPLYGRLAVDDPIGVPDGLWDRHVGQFSGGGLHEDAAEDSREALDRDEEALASRDPLIAGPGGQGQPAAGDQAMHVGMVAQHSPPGMQDGHDADPSADVLGIVGQCHQRLGRGLHQDAIQRLLMAPDDLSQGLRQREDHVEVLHR